MSMQRRTFLKLSAAGAAAIGGASLLGTWQANAADTRPLRTAPTTPFAVGVRQYNWMRGNRQVTTYVYYPAAGNPGGNPVTNAPVAPGVFPVCAYQHGYAGTPQGSPWRSSARWPRPVSSSPPSACPGSASATRPTATCPGTTPR